MLPGDDVINHVGKIREVFRKLAILATSGGALVNLGFQLLIHFISSRRVLAGQRRAGFGFEEHQQIVDVEIILQNGPFLGVQRALLRFLGQLFVSLQIIRRECEVQDRIGKAPRKIAARRVNHSLENCWMMQHIQIISHS
jgi:hypothetical protein